MAVAVVVDEKIKDGQQKEFVEYMRQMIELTKEEDGCIAYDLYEAADGSGAVVLLELWESKEALEQHMLSDHFKKFVPGGEVYKSGPPSVRVFNRL